MKANRKHDSVSRIEYRSNPLITDEVWNALHLKGNPDHRWESCETFLNYCLGYIGAYDGENLIGYVRVAWDARDHAFLLDPTVIPSMRRQGIGTELVKRATELAQKAGCEWLHVDFDPHLKEFYRECGFRHTEAGLIQLK